MATKSREYVLDELLCFLSNPIFQVPVLTFMEDRCMIFDPELDDCPEYHKTHEEYKRLVDRMLLSFEQDTGLDYKSIMNAVQEMSDKEDIRTIFQTVLEQVMSSVDFGLYVRVMTHKNIVLQEEALRMIMKNLGALPDSLVTGKKDGGRGEASRQKEEDAVLAAAMEKSRQEFEKQKRSSHREEEEMKAILEVSRSEAQRLSHSRQVEEKKIDMALKTGSSGGNVAVVPPVTAISQSGKPQPSKPLIDLKSAPTIGTIGGSMAAAAVHRPTPAAVHSKTAAPAPAHAPAPMAAPVSKPQLAARSTPQGGDMSSADAASNWMKSAQAETTASTQQSERYQAMQKSMEALSMEERQQRLAFLKEQRDKLVKMKKEEREKQLRRVESAQPQRPQSARAARAAMSGKPEPEKRDPEVEKRLAMRKAIADRLKSEVIGKKF